MPTIPGLVLKTLYVRGSLRSTPQGWQVALRNRIGSGAVTRFLRLKVDGVAFPPAALEVLVPGSPPRPATAISPQAPLALPAGLAVTLRLAGERLSPVQHRLALTVDTQELGTLEIPITDEV